MNSVKVLFVLLLVIGKFAYAVVPEASDYYKFPLTTDTLAHCVAKKDNKILFDKTLKDIYGYIPWGGIQYNNDDFRISLDDDDAGITFRFEEIRTGQSIRLSQNSRYEKGADGIYFDQTLLAYKEDWRKNDPSSAPDVLIQIWDPAIEKNITKSKNQKTITLKRTRLSQYDFGWKTKIIITTNPIIASETITIDCDYKL